MRAQKAFIPALLVMWTVLFPVNSHAASGKETAPRPNAPVSLSKDTLDIRDAVIEVAEVSKLNIFVSPAFRGQLSMDIKKLPSDEALRVMAAARSGVVKNIGPVRTMMPFSRASRQGPAELDFRTGNEPFSKTARSIELRRLLRAIARRARINIILGKSLEKSRRCLVILKKVTAAEAFRAVLQACGLDWTRLGGTVFVGDPEEVKQARDSYDKSRPN